MRKRHTVTANRFQAECSALLEEVARGKAEVVVTRRGVPLAKLVPVAHRRPVKSMARVVGDLLAPLDGEWIHGDVEGPTEPGSSC